MIGFLAVLLCACCSLGRSGPTEMDNSIQAHPEHLNISRRSYRPQVDVEQEEWAILARENVLRMRSDSIRCATPRPRVVKVQHVHPHAYKRFVPSCVELHRCDREAGCCDDETSVCSPVQKQRVFMYFYVVALQEHNGVPTMGVYGQVERLRFTNHTRCGCRKRRRGTKDPLVGQSMSTAVDGFATGTWWRFLVLAFTVCWTAVSMSRAMS